MLLFPCEAVWPCTSVCWEPFDYWFNFNTSIWSVPISYFFLIQPERLNVSRNSFISSRLSNLLAYNCSLFFCDIGYNFCSFISKFVYLGPLFLFLVTLSNSLPILFVFLKNQPLVLLTFSLACKNKSVSLNLAYAWCTTDNVLFPFISPVGHFSLYINAFHFLQCFRNIIFS